MPSRLSLPRGFVLAALPAAPLAARGRGAAAPRLELAAGIALARFA